jgi:hypothetical protein
VRRQYIPLKSVQLQQIPVCSTHHFTREQYQHSHLLPLTMLAAASTPHRHASISGSSRTRSHGPASVQAQPARLLTRCVCCCCVFSSLHQGSLILSTCAPLARDTLSLSTLCTRACVLVPASMHTVHTSPCTYNCLQVLGIQRAAATAAPAWSSSGSWLCCRGAAAVWQPCARWCGAGGPGPHRGW